MQPHDEPSQAPGSPAPHRRFPWVVSVLAAMVVLLAAAGFGWWAVGGGSDDAPKAARGDSATDAVGAAGQDRAEEARERRRAVGLVLDRMSRAVLERDKRAYLALVDTAQPRFRAVQARVFDRVAKVPLDAWEYRLAAGNGHARATAGGSLAWTAPVRLEYRLSGADSTFVRERRFTFVFRDAGWRLSDQARRAGRRAVSVPDIWDLGPIRIARGSSSLVIGAATHRDLPDQARLADQAVRDVRGLWRRPWSHRPVVLVPRTQRHMAALINSNGEGLGQIAAVTTGFAESGVTQGDQVVLNPRTWRTLVPLGQRVVIAHEVTHLATRAVTRRDVPTWLSEGFADYVAYHAVGLPASTVAQEVLDKVRAGRVPRELPDDADFDAARGDVSSAYEGAWLACRLIAQRYGERSLGRLYVRLADGVGGPSDADFRAVLGVSERQLTREWRQYLRNQAGG